MTQLIKNNKQIQSFLKIACCGFIVLILSACSSNSAKTPLKILSQLFGGLQEREQLIDNTVEEDMRREVKICLNKVENNPELRAECVDEAYAKVTDRKGLNQTSDDGTVEVRRVDDDEVVNESEEDSEDSQ